MYHLVMTNIAMENPNHKWRVLAGKIIYFYGPSIPWLCNKQPEGSLASFHMKSMEFPGFLTCFGPNPHGFCCLFLMSPLNQPRHPIPQRPTCAWCLQKSRASKWPASPPPAKKAGNFSWKYHGNYGESKQWLWIMTLDLMEYLWCREKIWPMVA